MVFRLILREVLSMRGSRFRGWILPEFELPPESELQASPSGLRYKLLEPGNWEPPQAHDTVTRRYGGWNLDGGLFDASSPGTASFPLDQVIKG